MLFVVYALNIMENTGIRINKYIADAGICSRRAADKLVEEGVVEIDGVKATAGSRVFEDSIVTVNGEAVGFANKKVYFAFNKPAGIVCTAEKKEKNNIIDFINYPVRLLYAGRLDKESEGLIILTNDGDLINSMMRARYGHEKEYIVTVDRDINKDFIYSLRNGVYLEELEVTTRKCRASLIDNRSFRIILTQGLNRQIRRMCEAFNVNVVALKRVRVMNIELGDLAPGNMRTISSEEMKELRKKLKEKNE